MKKYARLLASYAAIAITGMVLYTPWLVGLTPSDPSILRAGLSVICGIVLTGAFGASTYAYLHEPEYRLLETGEVRRHRRRPAQLRVHRAPGRGQLCRRGVRPDRDHGASSSAPLPRDRVHLWRDEPEHDKFWRWSRPPSARCCATAPCSQSHPVLRRGWLSQAPQRRGASSAGTEHPRKRAQRVYEGCASTTCARCSRRTSGCCWRWASSRWSSQTSRATTTARTTPRCSTRSKSLVEQTKYYR